MGVNDMYLKYFEIFGLGKYLMRFSTHDPARLGEKFVNEPELWKQTEDMVREVLKSSGINFVEVANEAAFYGPKIDFDVTDAIKPNAANQITIVGTRTFLNELGTGGIVAPVILYAPAAGKDAKLENVRDLKPTFP